MLPIPLCTRRMPKLEEYDLIEQGFGQNMEFYTEKNKELQLCQFHKYKQTNDEFIMFKETPQNVLEQQQILYAKKIKNIWLIYTRDPSDSQFSQEGFKYFLKLDTPFLSLWNKKDQLLAVIENIHCDLQISHYNKMKLLITNGAISKVPSVLYGDYVPKGCDYFSTIPPLYNSKTRQWQMQDSERLKAASKRNFLLGHHQNDDKIQTLKMGKIQTGVYVVDYKEPINFIIAFAVALATCELKSRIQQK